MEQDKIETELEEKSELESQEVQIETEIQRAKKKRREAIFELALFFILGALIGVTAKTEAVKKITIGFNDYQIKNTAPSYDVTAMKKNLDAEAAQQQAEQDAQQQLQQQPGDDQGQPSDDQSQAVDQSQTPQQSGQGQTQAPQQPGQPSPNQSQAQTQQ